MPSAGITFSIPATVICNSPLDPAVPVEAQRTAGNGDQIALLNPRPHDLDMAARGLHLPESFRPRLWRKILQAAQLRLHVGIERAASSGCSS